MTPTFNTIKVGLILALLAAIPAIYPATVALWIALLWVMMALIVKEIYALQNAQLSVQRKINNVLSHHAWSDAALILSNANDRDFKVSVYDMHPAFFNTKHLPQTHDLVSQSQVTINYQCMPLQRGDGFFSGVECRLSSGFHLISRKIFLAEEDHVRIYPNFRGNSASQLLLSRQYLDKFGISKLPRQGEGGDFHQLREFRDGDSIRQIDWKATSRMRKPISREFAEERDQQIVFLLDCGIRMRHRDEQGSHMDDALNAIVLLGRIALQQGDSTGLFTFGGVDRWIPPAKGHLAARRLMHGIYDLQPTLEMPDYQAAIESLSTKLKKRALVILISNFRNEDGDIARTALQRLNKRHLILMVDLREADLDNTLGLTPSTPEESLLWASAKHYSLVRQKQHRLAQARGTKLLDVTPQKLSANLISRYLAIKQMGLL